MTEGVKIVVKNGTSAEKQMRILLCGLLETYDLSGWIFTKFVDIDEKAMPHSHPVLTLNTANEDNETMALAEFVHEQLHWFEEQHTANRDRAIAETRMHYPTVPWARPEGGGDEESTRLHLLVCYLEYQALKCLLGNEIARQTILQLSRHHYCWIYRTVLSDEKSIGSIISQYDLVPAPLRGRQT